MKASCFLLLFGAAASLPSAFLARAQTCNLFPIALPADRLSNATPGVVLTNIFHGPARGNFGWLTWAGSPSEPTLGASLAAPGDSRTYVNPDDSSDHQVSIGDWVQGKPGVSNGKSIRDALDALKQMEITVPVWDAARGQGAGAAYRVSGFARIHLLSYQLPGQNRIIVRYLGPATCGLQNHPPVVSVGGDQTITLPDAATLAGAVTDDGLPDGSVLGVSWAQLTGPAATSIVSPHHTNSAVQFSQPGTYTFSFTATDSQLSASNTLVVTVNRANETPLAFSLHVTNREDVTLEIQLRAHDPEGSNLTYAITAPPAHGLLTGDLPNVRYTAFPDYNGPDSFTFTAGDGLLVSARAVVTITNLPENDAPNAVPVETSTLEDTPVTVDFSGADVDGDFITFTVIQQPQHGTLDVTATNATYQPAANYHGHDTFLYIANDPFTNSTPAVVTISVLSVNDIPLVDVGPDAALNLPTNTIALSAFVFDEEFAGTNLLLQWSSMGPADAQFEFPTNSATTVTFPTNGVYLLRLTVTDLLATNSDELTVTINAPPTVNSGSNQWITLPAVAALDGSASDDALPTNHLRTAWLASGPGTVIFADPLQTNTTASFSASGAYTLSLVADDGWARTTNSTTVMVNRAPAVDAGSHQVITNLFTTMTASVHDDGFPSNALNLAWSQVSGPGEALFATNTESATVTFSTNGTYILRLTAEDGAAQSSSEVTIHINTAPRVNAGDDQRIVLGHAAPLAAVITDDGLPPGCALALYWQIVSGPGIGSFGDPNTAQPAVAFNAPGIYVLRLTADDSQLTGSDELTITVVPPNYAPTVSAGTSQLVNFPAGVNLHGAATDDGFPEGGALHVHWSKFAGPGAVAFGTPNQNDTTASFDSPGLYLLAFVAEDSELSSTGYVAIAVNDPPRVSAGADQITTLSNHFVLHGSVADDGLPFGVTNIAWTKVAGPGTALFIHPTSAETPVRFSAIGEYVLRLSVTDSNAITSDEVSISVRPDGANLPPLVNAGPNQVIALTNVAVLAGSVTDDALPYGVPLLIAWTKVSGPGDVTLADSNSPATTATFGISGTYVLQLTATDSEFERSSQVTISIYTDNQPPAVNAGPDQTNIRGPVTLSGTVFDDGFPTNGTLTVHWQKISGPGLTFIEHTNHASTEVSFSEAGIYLFRFTASDGELSVSDEVTVIITGNQPPIVDAGPDHVIDLITGAGAATNSTTTYPPTVDAWRYGQSQPGLTGIYGNFCCVPDVRRGGLAWSGTDLYVGGGFLNANGAQMQSIARWDGCSYFPLIDPRPSIGFVSGGTSINPIGARGKDVFVAGGFLKDVDGNGRLDFTARWNGTNWVAWGFTLASNFAERYAMLVANNAVYFGGQFKFQTSNVPAAPLSFNLAKWDGTNWVALGNGLRDIRDDNAFVSIQFGRVSAIAIAPNGDVYAGGRFITQTATGLATNLARWTGAQWEVVDNQLNGGTPEILALAFNSVGELLVGGDFIRAGSLTVNRIARWDGTNWSALGSGFNSTIHAITLRGSEIFAGGGFTESGSSSISRIARWDGAAWRSISNGVNSTVVALATTPTGIYLGGQFNTAGSQVANGIAKWGQNEVASVLGPAPLSVQTQNSNGADVPVTLQVKHPCGRALTVIWNVDGGASEQTNVLAPGTTTAFVGVSLTNFYPPGVHTLVATINDGDNGPITFATTIAVLTPAVATLTGSISDDGLPAPGNLTALWQEVSGPSSVGFLHPNAAATEAYFSAIGTYVLRLTGTDEELQNSDDTIIAVRAAGSVNRPPTVFAGNGQDITIADTAVLSGFVLDDGLPTTNVVAAWSKLSGPGQALFDVVASATASVSFDAPGSYVLRLTAHDGEFSSFDDLTINVSAVTNIPPVVSAGPDQSAIVAGSTRLQGGVDDDGLPFGIVNSSWSQQSGPGGVLFRVENGVTFALFSDPGEYVLRLTANDGKATSFDEVAVTVYAANDVPQVKIISPLDGATITAPTILTGTVSSDILQSWALQSRLKPADSLSAGGEGQGEVAGFHWTVLSTGNVSVANGPLGTFDPTLLLNGIYEVKLSAIDLAGRGNETEPITIIVDRNMKVGHFTLSFNDLTIPVAGIPIQVIRSYDSRDKRRGDFGIGWTLQFKDVRLQKNRHLGRGWDQTASGGLFPNYCVGTSRPRIVTITFPDGKVHKFQAEPTPTCQFGVPLIYPKMQFVPLGNTHSGTHTSPNPLPALGGSGEGSGNGTLVPVSLNWRNGARVVDDQLVFGGAVPDRADFVSYEVLLDPPPGSADNILYNPDLFEFTTPEGYTYLISETNGLRSLTDPNGNTLAITTNGLTWSNSLSAGGEGQGEVAPTLSILFQRDALGRITNIVDGLGQSVKYDYDANGNLVAVRDRVGNTNAFSYNARHELLTLRDGLGFQVLSNSYDGSGRLVEQQDANGNSSFYARDLEKRIEYLTNRLGYVSSQEYDDRGNIVRTVDADEVVSTFIYDGNDNLVAVSNAACACGTTFEYDERDRLLVERDAAGNTKRYSYNDRGQVLLFTDPAGFTTTNRYDASGNLLAISDAMGVTTSFSYTRQGKVAAVTNAQGGTVLFTYDAFGNLTNEVDELGNGIRYTVDEIGRLVSQSRSRRVRIAATAKGKISESEPPHPDPLPRRRGNGPAKHHLQHEPLIGDTEFYHTNTVVRFAHDANGRLRATLLEESVNGIPHYEKVYDSNGQPILTTGPCGTTATFYGKDGKVTRIVHPDGNAETFTYDKAGQRADHTTTRGKTSYSWDKAGRVETVTFPDSSQISAGYNKRGQLVSETDQNGCTSTYEYDSVGNRIAVTDGLGNRTEYTYDTRRSCTRVMDALNRATVLEYDYLNRHTKITFPDGTSHSATYLGRLVQSVTDEAGRTTQRDYDKSGRLISTLDHAGRRTTFQYDEVGNLLASMEPGNRLTVHDYNQLGHRIRTELPGARTEIFEHDLCGRVTKRTDAEGGVTEIEYDNGGRILSVVDPEKLATTYGYDHKGDLNQVLNGNGEATRFATDVMGRRVKTTFPDGTEELSSFVGGRLAAHQNRTGGSTTYSYDCASRPTSVTDPGGRTTVYEYDRGGRAIAITSAGRRSQFEYDPRDRRTKVIRFDGAVETFSYDLLGRLSSATDAGGSTLDYSYDSADRVASIRGPLGSSRSFTYTDAGFMTSVTDPVSGTTSYSHDEQGNVTTTQLPDGTATRSSYDDLGRQLEFVDARGHSTSFEYDRNGRLVEQTTASGATTLYTYDGAGRMLTMVDALQRSTVFTHNVAERTRVTQWPDGRSKTDRFDPAGRLLSTADEEGRTTRYTYDALGRLKSVANPLGQVASYDYDPQDRLLQKVDVLGRAESFQYNDMARTVVHEVPGGFSERLQLDAMGNVLERTDFNGAKTSYGYDALHRLQSITPDGQSANSAAISFTLDALGRRLSMSDGTGTTSYDYDARGRVLRKGTPQGTLTYTYDNNGNVTGVASSNPNGASATYQYDVMDRLSAVNDSRLGTTTYGYDAVGNLKTVSKPNGLACSYEYDARDRLRTVTHGAVANYQYALDGVGNRTGVTEVFAPLSRNGERVHAYDALDRLGTESISVNGAPALIDYAYDGVGNRLSRTSTLAALPSSTDTFDASDRPLRDGFNANGATVTATNTVPGSSSGESVVDEYDFQDRLVRRTATLNAETRTLNFLYDGDGNRVAQTVGGVTTHYLVDEINPTGWPQVLEEITSQNGNSAVTRVNAWGHGLIGQDYFDGSAWQRRIPGMDGMGSVRFLTDQTGNVTDSFDYDAFGNTIACTGSTAFTHLYRGEQFDPQLGMYYLRARYYNPDRGRFWTRDSFDGFLEDPQSQHRYSYAQNNPVNRIDPGGHFAMTESLVVSALAVDVRSMMGNLWSGINSFGHGLAGGEALKAKNHASGLFVQGLVPETGVYLGRQNFFNTLQGAPFLLSLNPYIYIPEYDCFTCEKVGFGAYSAFFGAVARHPMFQFEESPLARDIDGWLRGDPIRNGWNVVKEKTLQTGDNIGFLAARAAGHGEFYEGSSQLYQNIAAAPQNYDADKIEGELAWGTLRSVGNIASFGALDVSLEGYNAWQTGDVSGLESASANVFLGAIGGRLFGMESYGLAGARAELQASLATMQRGLAAARALNRSARAQTQELQKLLGNKCLDNLTVNRLRSIYDRDAAQRVFVKDGARLSTLPSSGASLVATPDKTTTILGRYHPDLAPIITEVAGGLKSWNLGPKPGGFNVLNIPDGVYQRWGAEAFWELFNKPWLNAAIQRGDEIILATKPTASTLIGSSGELTGFGREYQYLTSRGFKYNAATHRMTRP